MVLHPLARYLYMVRKRLVRYCLQVKFLVTTRKPLFPPVPPPNINFNQLANHTDVAQYIETYRKDSHSRELPFLRKISALNSESRTLDFGCGLGRLASAFLAEGEGVGHYFGWEPDKKALTWLKKNYADFNRFRFNGSPLPKHHTYLSGKTSNDTTNPDLALPNNEIWHEFIGNSKFDLIWSCSVFTHMFPNSAIEILKLFKQIAKPGSLIVNTFLCVDTRAEKELLLGNTDRKLPFRVNGIRTFSYENPLICTAYPLETLNQVYASAGLPQPEISYGTWSGRDNRVTYMDLVIVQIPTM